MNKKDPFILYGTEFKHRLLLGSAHYRSPKSLLDAINSSDCAMITLSIRRQTASQIKDNGYWDILRNSCCPLLPNTAGCRTAPEAIKLAELSRALFDTNWIKLEVIGDEYNLQPDSIELILAAEQLVKEGFNVLPYCTDDLVICKRLLDVGCQALMPWAAPIGTGLGLINPYALQSLRHRLKEIPLIIDAGLGKPSQAMQAMEMGFDAVLVNTAVAKADDTTQMAKAFSAAVDFGRQAFQAGCMIAEPTAVPSTPILGMPFF